MNPTNHKLASVKLNRTKTSRRDFLKLTALGLGGSVLACSGLAAVALHQPKIEYARNQCDMEANMKKVLVAYASLCGSTGEIAQVIGQELCNNGYVVDVRPAHEVRDIHPYQYVVLGSAVRNGKLYDEALSFAKKFGGKLQDKSVAYFFSGVTMNTDTPERRKTALACLDPLIQIREPAEVGLFGGKVDLSKMSPMWRFMLSWVKEGEMAPGDHRDWDTIRTWAQGLTGIF